MAANPIPEPKSDAATEVSQVKTKRIIDVRMRGYQIHPAQKLFCESTAKHKIIRAGRRGGKTVGAATLALLYFLRGKRVLYVAPTANQLQAFWKEIKKALDNGIAYGLYKKNETEKWIQGPTIENRIRAMTGWNADNIRGDACDLLILDEWQVMDESAWEEVGAPMLVDKNGDVVFIYTPPSRASRSTSKASDPMHATKLFKRHNDDPSMKEIYVDVAPELREHLVDIGIKITKDGKTKIGKTNGKWLCVTFSSHLNPYISEEGLQEVTHNMTSLAYRQEILALEIDEVPGALWKREWLEKGRTEMYNHAQVVAIA